MIEALHPRLRKAISNAYYDARNIGRTMEQAADDAADESEKVVKTWLAENAAAMAEPQPFQFGWFDFEPEPELTGDGSGDPDKHILTIVADPGHDNDEVAVIVHRTCDGKFPIDGTLAESKRETAKALVDLLNASDFATTLQQINLRSHHE